MGPYGHIHSEGSFLGSVGPRALDPVDVMFAACVHVVGEGIGVYARTRASVGVGGLGGDATIVHDRARRALHTSGPSLMGMTCAGVG